MAEQDKLLSRKAVSEKLGGICKATIYDWIKKRDFPRPILLGPSCARWSEAEVAAWVARQKAQRTAA